MTSRQPESGFTLVELLVTVVIMTIVIIGITSGLLVVLKTYPSDATRLTQDEGSQLLSTWLQADALSASNFDATGTVSTCAGGPTKLRLTWSDFDGAHSFEASYALTGTILTRYYCVDHGTATLTKVGRNVQSARATVTGRQVTFVVTDIVCPPGVTPNAGCAGGSTYTFTVSASGRTPPTTTSTSTTSTSTTSTSTTSTTTPTTTTTTPVCTITSANVNPPSASDALSGNGGHLKDDVTLTVVTTGPCGPLNYSVDPGNDPRQTNALTPCAGGPTCPSPPTIKWTGFIAANSVKWTGSPSGVSHPFTVLDGSTSAPIGGSIAFTVTS